MRRLECYVPPVVPADNGGGGAKTYTAINENGEEVDVPSPVKTPNKKQKKATLATKASKAQIHHTSEVIHRCGIFVHRSKIMKSLTNYSSLVGIYTFPTQRHAGRHSIILIKHRHTLDPLAPRRPFCLLQIHLSGQPCLWHLMHLMTTIMQWPTTLHPIVRLQHFTVASIKRYVLDPLTIAIRMQ